MKKIILSLLVTLFISAIACAAPAEKDPGGFNGYPWGTSFETIHDKVQLKEYSNKNNSSCYVGMKEVTYIDENSMVAKLYFFDNNQLFGGAIAVYNHSEYYGYFLDEMQKSLGTFDGFRTKEKLHFHQFPTTLIFYSSGQKISDLDGLSLFVSKDYYEKIRKISGRLNSFKALEYAIKETLS